MSSQISDIYIRKPAARRIAGLPVTALVGGIVAVGAVAAWLLNSPRERPLADRTLADRTGGPLAPQAPVPGPVLVAVTPAVPNASQIHVA